MGAFTDLLESGGQIGKQLFVYGVLYSVVNALTQPYQRDLAYLVNEKNPNVVLSPADLADMVVRAITTSDKAEGEAAKSGMTPDRFLDLVHSAGEPPGIESVLQWYRRGLVPWGEAGPTKATVANAVATSRIYTYWSDIIRQSNIEPIPAAVMVDAMVENQVTGGTRSIVEGAAGGATILPNVVGSTSFYETMYANGFTPDQADLMVRVRGNPPSPGELFTLYRRGEIPLTGRGGDALTVEQGIYEGATKDKWWPTIAGLIRTIPSEYYIKLMVTQGTISPELATSLLQQLGYTTQVVAGIVGASQKTAVSTYRKLVESTIVKLYQDRAIARTEALTLLTTIGYGKDAATFVLVAVDLTTQQKAVSAAISKIGNRYIARKLSGITARQALASLGVPSGEVTALLQTWTLERTVTVKLLTPAQVVDAWKYTIMTADQALTYLQALGYTKYDAYVLLSVKNEAPLATSPPPPTRTTFTS